MEDTPKVELGKVFTRPMFYYKWFWQDFRSSRKVRNMNYIERGLYRELLDECWAVGSIPDDIEELAEICGCPTQVMESAWQMLSRCFITCSTCQENGSIRRLTNSKLEEQRTEKDQIRIIKAMSGKLGGEAKAKAKANIPVADAKESVADAKHMVSICQEKVSIPSKNKHEHEHDNQDRRENTGEGEPTSDSGGIVPDLEQKAKPKKQPAASKDTAPHILLGDYKNVSMSAVEYQRLCNEFTKEAADKAICEVDIWMGKNEKNKKKWTSHYMGVLGWIKENNIKAQGTLPFNRPDKSQNVGDKFMESLNVGR